MEFAVVDAIFVDHFGQFDVEAAVFGYFHELALAEPFDGLQSFGGFLEAKGGGGDGIKREAVLQGVLQFDEHVERGQLP